MRPKGVVLIAVMVTVALAAMVAAGLLFRMRASVLASTAVQNGEQAYAAAMSGVQRALAVLRDSAGDVETWYDNPELFRNQLVYDDGACRWYFTVYAFNPQDPTTPRYGLSDEAGKININVAGQDALRSLANMTDELVDCLLDYRDRDDDVRPQGAEQEYYDQLAWPYLIKNGPLATVEELLLIKGFNGSVVYGEDANLNGVLDANEDDGEESFPPDDGDGELDRGLTGLTTAISYEPDSDNEGNPRVNINGDADRLGEIGLSDETVRFIRFYRAEDKSFIHPSQLLEMRYRLEREQEDEDGTVFPAGTWIDSGVGEGDLPLVCDRLTAGATGGRGRRRFRAGLLNVNTATAEALATIEGVDESAARTIVDIRGQLDGETKATIAWLYTQGVLDADAFKAAAPHLTARSFQYRIRCVGFGVPCGRIRVIEAVVDLARGEPRISYLREITRLGVPISLDVEVREVGR